MKWLRYCECCNTEMYAGETVFEFDNELYCEGCFDRKIEKLREEAPRILKKSECEPENPNEGCYSHSW